MKILECLMPAFYKKQNIIHTFVVFIIAFLLFGNTQIKGQNVDSTYIFSPEILMKLDYYIKENAPKESAFIFVKGVAARFIQAKQWEKADSVFEKYRPLFKEMDKRFEKINRILNAPEEGLVIVNLGIGINSDFSEYTPVPTVDELKLYFTGNIRNDGLGGEDVFS